MSLLDVLYLVLARNHIPYKISLHVNYQLAQPVTAHSYIKQVRILLPGDTHVQLWWP